MATYELESNNSISSATSISSGASITGQLSSSSDRDYYVINASGAGSIEVDLDSSSSYSRHSVTILDANGQELSSIDSYGDESFGAGIASAGQYYVLVEDSDSGYGFDTDSYELDIRFSSSRYELESNNSISSATSISSGASITGQLSSSSDRDYYVINASGAGSIEVDLDSSSSYSRHSVTILDANGQELSSIDSYGDESFGAGIASAGQYYVLVEDSDSGYGFDTDSYELTVTAPSAPSNPVYSPPPSVSPTQNYTAQWSNNFMSFGPHYVGDTIEASINVTDQNGVGPINYGWWKYDGINTIDTGVTGPTYTISQADVGYSLFFDAFMYDSAGNLELTPDFYGIWENDAWVTVQPAVLPPTYSVTSVRNSISEGESAVFNISTQNLPAYSNINYQLSGVSTSDITGSSLSGQVTTNSSGSATVTIPTINDYISEGTETLTLRLNTGETASVNIRDISPTYSINAVRNSISEGESAVFNIATQNLPSYSSINYSLSGISTADITGYSLTGLATTNANGTATVTVTTVTDQIDEGTESIVLTISASGDSASVTINDSSQTFQVAPSVRTVSEGQSVTFDIQTQNVPGGTQLGYVVTGISPADVGQVGFAIGGTVALDQFGRSSITLSPVLDGVIEGDEAMEFRLIRPGELNDAAASASVTITDASAAYLVSSDALSVFEGETVTFSVEKTSAVGSNLVPYTLQGVDASDVLGGSLSGSVQLDSNGLGVVPIVINNDPLTEGVEQLSFVLENGVRSSVTVRDFVQTQSIESVSYENGSHLSEGFGNGVVMNYISNDTTIRSLTFDLLADGATEPEASLTVTTDVSGNASGTLRLTNDTFPEPSQTYLIQLSGNPQVSQYVQFRDDDSGNPISGGSGSEVLTTSDDDDVVDAGIGDDFVIASRGNDFIDGGVGKDAVEYQGSTSSEISLRKDGDAVVVGLSGKSDRLLNVERLHFEDQWVALDMNGNAGNAAKMIVAAFGSELLDDYLGIGIGVADDGLSMSGLANLVVNTDLMPFSTSGQFVDLVFNNLLDRDANALEKSLYSGYLNDGLYTEADLLVMAADTQMANASMLDFAIDNVGLPYLDTLV